MIVALPLVILAATGCLPGASSPSDWVYTNPEYLRVAPEDEDGDVLVSLKVTVENRATEHRRATVTVRGVDREGFELFDVVLSGSVPPGGSAILTDTVYVNAVTFRRTDRAEVEE